MKKGKDKNKCVFQSLSISRLAEKKKHGGAVLSSSLPFLDRRVKEKLILLNLAQLILAKKCLGPEQQLQSVDKLKRG